MFWFQRHCNAISSWTLLSLILCSATHAQRISTSGPVPPLQWINLTNYLTGSSAPPLKDASIGYDESSHTLLIFGGESSQGIKQSSTYLLNLNSLSWSTPSPPDGLNQRPPARSAAISGDDIAANYRSAHIIIGGVGSSGEALSDVWEFDYLNQFWSQVTLSPGGPSARYDAVGGIDTRSPIITAADLSYPNNSFYLAGGINGSNVSPLSDVWRLNVTGALSSNNAHDVSASWEQIPISASNIPSKVGAAGAVVSQGTQQIIAIGGCSSSIAFVPNASCAQADSYVINLQEESISAPSGCPAPRLDGTVVANFNGQSSDFTKQVFLVLGLFNTSLWSDGGGLEKGEVDILRIDTGEWSRILPAGDPGISGGTPAFPSPRQGAVGLSYSQTLVGSTPNIASDTIIFGGVDASGTYLSEVWILRAYNAILMQSNQTWSGYINNDLVGGVNASGQGVTVQFMTECASALTPAATQSSAYEPTSAPSATSTGSPSPTSSTSSTPRYDTSVVHKALSPISVALVLPAVVFARLSLASSDTAQLAGHNILLYSSIIIGLAAYGLGIAGLATSFTSIKTTSSLMKRSSTSSDVLKTAHGRAGIALFIVFYGVLPILYALLFCYERAIDPTSDEAQSSREDGKEHLGEAAEKEGLFARRVSSPGPRSADGHLAGNRPSEPRQRVRSWGGLGSLGLPGRRSSESGVESTGASSPSRSFEVTNRPIRTRRASGNSLAAFSDPRSSGAPRNLSDMSWVDGRRSMNNLGEGDYNHLNHRGVDPSTPGTITMDMTSTSGLMTTTLHPVASPSMPDPIIGFLHILFHAVLLGLCILSLVALWFRAPLATFIVFLIGTVLFYMVLVTLAWFGQPRTSVLSVLVARLRGLPTHPGHSPGTASPQRPLSTAGSEVPFPTEHRGPYQHHQPPYRAAMSIGLDDYPTSLSHGHGTTDMDDDEEDEDTRQRRIEEEMSRRDVSIVTVPKRKLFLTNPEESR